MAGWRNSQEKFSRSVTNGVPTRIIKNTRIFASTCRVTGRPLWSGVRKQKEFCTKLPGTAKSLWRTGNEPYELCSRPANPIKRMRVIARSWLAFVIALAFASCGEPEKAKLATVRPSVTRPAGEFDEIGTITLYPGESCASQVVFIFHSGLKSISLAAPWHQS